MRRVHKNISTMIGAGAAMLIAVGAGSVAGGAPDRAAAAETLSPSDQATRAPFPAPTFDSAAEKAAQQAVYDDQIRQVHEFQEANPEDLAGMESLISELWGGSLKVSVEGSTDPISGAEAQKLIDQLAVAPPNDAPNAAVSAVPLDAFNVSFAYYLVPSTDEYTSEVYGRWNFRDDYVNGSAPDDIASNRMELPCTQMGNSTIVTYDYLNNVTGKGYIRDAGVGTNSPIAGIRDTTSGFMISNDHGFLRTRLRGYCGPAEPRGMFTYEHNQDGGAITSVSASFFGFGVSYSGGTPSLQKSSGVVYW